MNLIIFHYHYRPGGIRRVIELATPHLLREGNGRVTKVILAGGEPPDPLWETGFRKRLGATPVEFFIERTFNYISEQRMRISSVDRRIRSKLTELFEREAPGEAVVWAHNLSIARNLILNRELVRVCTQLEVPLIAHHHDWWFENRWLRWPEMRRCGFPTLQAAARSIFPSVSVVRHTGINQRDVDLLQRHFPTRANWLPNLAEHSRPPSRLRIRKAREWVWHRIDQRDTPVWIVPCRLLRRKNIAEAILLTRWLRPDAWLLTTGGPSSADEVPYARKLQRSIDKQKWPVRLGVLEGDEEGKPSVAELLAMSEAILLTSLQEGFGLPYLEASGANRPLIARSIPNIAPDLKQFGFTFPQLYGEIRIDPRLFDYQAERIRQKRLFERWRGQLPHACRSWVGVPELLRRQGDRTPVPFSRLTLAAQIEVLSQPAQRSWELALPLNPFLEAWKAPAMEGTLKATLWPEKADHWLSGPAYGKRFWSINDAEAGPPPTSDESAAAQQDFMRQRLSADYLFPLLWAKES